MTMDYQSLYKTESHGIYGGFGLKIEVAATKLPDLTVRAIQLAAWEAASRVEAEVMAAVVAANPEAQERRRAERASIVALFPELVLVEEIPNGYCSKWCCRHLPWFVITVPVGRFKIGWRKRVINIDWSDTQGLKTADELFRTEDVTKGERCIHAWSLDHARRYIQAVLGSK